MTKTEERPATESKPRPANRCTLTLNINGTDYRVRPIDPGFAGVRAFRLRKVSGEHEETHTNYTIIQGLDELRCDCGSFCFRHDGQGTACKHLSAAVALGLLDDFRNPVPRTHAGR